MVASDYLRDARVVVIGGGVIGSALGYRLAQSGAQVTVVDRAYPGAGTTGNSFGYINGTFKTPRSYQRLNVMSIRDHEALADELDAHWAWVGGSLHWAEAADGGSLSALRDLVRQLRGWGMRIDTLTPEQVMRELEPDLWIDPEAVPEVYRIDRAGWVDPVAFAHGALEAATRRYGVALVRDEVVGLPRSGDVIEAVVLADGRRLDADVIVDAAGPEAGRIAALAGVSLPMERVPGVLMTTAPAPVCLRHVVYAAPGNVHPDGGSRLMLQVESLDSLLLDEPRLALDHPAVVEAAERMRTVVPGLRGVPLEALRHGVRSMPGDGLPIVGFDPEVANLYHVVTHSGVTLAPRLALLITEELTGGDASELDPYRLTRFGADRSGSALSFSSGE